MAAVLNLKNENQTLNYLNAYHCIGRSTTSVDTLIEAAEISRMHAVLEWRDKQWLIRDISHNGTWINNQKLEKDSPHKLKVGDMMFFGSANTHGFRVQDLSPPQNMLLAVEQSVSKSTNESANKTTENPIFLSDYNLLPSAHQPEMALFYVASKEQWYKEFVDDADGKAFPVANLDLLTFANQSWQLKLIINNENTVNLAKTKLLAHQIKYRFNLSQDEENTELTIKTDEEEHYLANSVHHYLTLTLARHRNEDAEKGFDEYSQGWRLPETIATEIGCDIPLLNTHVFRAKQQFIEKLAGACDGDDLIERKGNKIRFSGSFYRIYKGSKLIVNSEQGKVPLMVLHA
tara:strand:- start:291 stop:1328 length:1038 start_codon:yes stop_codon:yes gene_type:complete